MSEHIFIVQIGPVQSFIAAARKVQDLAVGSTLLSNLARSGVEAAEQQGAVMLFPMRRADNGKLPQSVPHRFAFISSENPSEICRNIKNAIKEQWEAYATAVKNKINEYHVGEPGWSDVFDNQIKNWLEITWAAVPYDETQHGESYKRVNQALAARKQFRDFQQVDEGGDKCTMTGSQSALKIDWKKLEAKLGYDEDVFFRGSEKLGSIALIKRVLPRTEIDEFEKLRSYTDITAIAGVPEGNPTGRDVERYFAVLHMDGDKMGEALGKLQTRKGHKAFSSKLAQFAEKTVQKFEDKHQILSDTGKKRTIVVYAGGDDVLALAPVHIVLNLAEDLRNEFAKDMQAFIEAVKADEPDLAEYKFHASAGISISYYKSPLDIALNTARNAEKTAKNEKLYDRNAVVIRETTHSGNIRDAGGKWDDKGILFIEFMEQIRSSIAKQELSSKIGFDMQQIHFEMVETSDTPDALKSLLKDARAAEIKRIVKRRIGEQVAQERKAEIMNDLLPKLIQLGESDDCGWETLANRVIMARFLAQGDMK